MGQGVGSPSCPRSQRRGSVNTSNVYHRRRPIVTQMIYSLSIQIRFSSLLQGKRHTDASLKNDLLSSSLSIYLFSAVAYEQGCIYCHQIFMLHLGWSIFNMGSVPNAWLAETEEQGKPSMAANWKRFAKYVKTPLTEKTVVSNLVSKQKAPSADASNCCDGFKVLPRLHCARLRGNRAEMAF